MDSRVIKAKNAESGTIGATLSDSETTSITLSPVPEHAPGVLVMRPGTAYEEHIFFKERDAGAGTVSGLVRDYTNLNGGSGREHLNGASYETMQASEYINNIVDAIQEGWVMEPQDSTKVDADTFTVNTNKTAIYTVGKFVRYNQDDESIGVVVSSSYSAGTGLTTVEVKGVTVPTLASVEVAFFQPKGFSSAMPAFYGEDSVGTDAYAITVVPNFGAYFVGMTILLKAGTVNTGAATLNVNSLGAVDIKKKHDQDLEDGDIEAGQYVILIYDGTNFQMVSMVAADAWLVGIMVVDPTTDVSTGDGKAFFRVPAELNGYNLTRVAAAAYTAGVTGTMDIQLRNKTQAADMLSTKMTIDTTETDTATAAAPAVIDTDEDDVATGDQIAVDVDAVQTTAAKGLYVELLFTKP